MAKKRPQPKTPDRSGGTGVIEVELAQSLGLSEALTIGIGTMIGAGIFVLPGFIIAKAGPAAVLSFALGGVVALFCAMSAAEVSTGMPKSGGAYYIISRSLGPVWGAIIGWGSWFGLIFATAFYAIGFGEYVHAWTGLSPVWLGVVMTALLVGLNLVGAKAAGAAQNFIVAILVLVMILFIGRAAPAIEPTLLSGDFAPFGMGAIFGGTATLFVTYCGFGEVASMAEEIKNPGRNLPRALIGSVIIVTLLYCAVLTMLVMLRPADELTSATVVADVAKDLMGPVGGAIILIGAVLATVSSANASIMSASRISFAMGRDNMMWNWLSVVHPRFRVPHRAVLVTGVLIIGVLFLGGLELLAEAAGLLHLLMYGLMCLAVIILRGAGSMAYQPAYRVPWFPLIPLLGFLGTVIIAFFMAPIVLLMSGGLILFAIVHFYSWARCRTEVTGAWPRFVRRSILEPAIGFVEQRGAVAAELPAAIVAVRNPERERARLELCAALLARSKGRVLAVNVFIAEGGRLTPDVIELHRATIRERTAQLVRATEPIALAGARVTSHVPVSTTALRGLVSAVEISDATLAVLGWPAPGPDQPQQATLMDDLVTLTRAHVLVLREGRAWPPPDVQVLVSAGEKAMLALAVAARLANSWQCPLAVVLVVPEGLSSEAESEAENVLRERLREYGRATLQTVHESDIVAAARRASTRAAMGHAAGEPSGPLRALPSSARRACRGDRPRC